MHAVAAASCRCCWSEGAAACCAGRDLMLQGARWSVASRGNHHTKHTQHTGEGPRGRAGWVRGMAGSGGDLSLRRRACKQDASPARVWVAGQARIAAAQPLLAHAGSCLLGRRAQVQPLPQAAVSEQRAVGTRERTSGMLRTLWLPPALASLRGCTGRRNAYWRSRMPRAWPGHTAGCSPVGGSAGSDGSCAEAGAGAHKRGPARQNASPTAC